MTDTTNMRKHSMCRIVTVLLLMAASPSNSYAKGYVAVGGGAGGEADASNVSFEIGATSSAHESNTFGALSIGIILNSDDVPSDTLDYPVPHWDYELLGTKQQGNEIAGLFKYGVEVKKESGIFLFGLGGLSFAKEIELARSNVTGWYYEQSSSYEYYGIYGGGVCYFSQTHSFSLHLDIDNRRGITGSIGFIF